MFRKISRKRGAAALVVIAVLAVAGGAYAYFTSSGSGNGAATVGSASNFTVTPQTATGGPLLPGAGSETINYTVTNPSSAGHQNLSATTASVAADGSGNVIQGGTAVSGCKASWFSAANSGPAAADLAPGGTATGSVVVTMTDAAVSQDSCQGVSPQILITAS